MRHLTQTKAAYQTGSHPAQQTANTSPHARESTPMQDKGTTSSPSPAPSRAVNETDRDQAKALATAAAFNMPDDCEHCRGTGRSSTTAQQMVHVFGPYWFGQNWGLDRLRAAIDSADHIRWVDDPTGHDLVVMLDGELYQLQVKRPERAENAA